VSVPYSTVAAFILLLPTTYVEHLAVMCSGASTALLNQMVTAEFREQAA
jgi:hypothetical protein